MCVEGRPCANALGQAEDVALKEQPGTHHRSLLDPTDSCTSGSRPWVPGLWHGDLQ